MYVNDIKNKLVSLEDGRFSLNRKVTTRKPKGT